MDGISSAAAVLQVLGNAISVAVRAARFVNNVRNAEVFQSDFFQGLQFSQSTIELLKRQLRTENFGQPYDEDIKEVNKLVHEIAQDCRKCYRTLSRLYSNPSNNIIRRLSGGLMREIRQPEIDSVTARFRSNVGNIQALLSVLQLIANDQQTNRIEERLQDIQEKLYPLQGLRDKLLDSLKNLRDSRQDPERIHLPERISQTCNEIVLSWDTSACIKLTDSTLKTANSICAKVSSVGSTRSLSFADERFDLADSPADTSWIQFGPNDGTSITLSMTTTFLEIYIKELNEEFEKGSYEKCRRYIQEALEWGDYRYWEYDVEFHQWFDLQLRLAEVYEKEGNFQDAWKSIVLIRECSDTNNLECRNISNLQEVQLRCATARLFLREYECEYECEYERGHSSGHSNARGELKQQAIKAFGAADTIFRDASISEEGLVSVNPTAQQLLVDSALTLDKVYGILDDTAGRRSLRIGHAILYETLPQLDSTALLTRSAVSEPRALGSISIPETSPSPPRSTSGSSDIFTTSPLSPRTETTRPSATPDQETTEDGQSPDHTMNIITTDGDKLSKLFDAAKNHNIKSLQDTFSEFEPHINARDEAGMNVLHHVLTKLGGEDDVKVLIRNGVDVNASDNHGNTPLHYCARRNNFQCAKLILRTKNVIIDSTNNSNQTPAQLAINEGGMYYTDMLRLLIKYKANFDWPGIPRDIQDILQRLTQEINASRGNQILQGRRDSRASESSRSSQQSRWLRYRAIGST